MNRVNVLEVRWNPNIIGGADKISWYLYRYLNIDQRIGIVENEPHSTANIENWNGIVHNHTFVVSVVKTAKEHNLPVVSTIHAIPNDARNKTAQQQTALASDKITVINNWLRDYVIKNYGVDKSKVMVINNGSPIHLSGLIKEDADRDYLVIGYHGRITESKGIPTLIKAVELIRENTELDVRLNLLGWDMMKLKPPDWVEIHPPVISEYKIAKWLTGIDLEVIPTLTDQQPLSAIESLMVGVPVLISKLPTLEEFNGLVNWIKDPKNPYEVAMKSLVLLNKSVNHEKLREEAIKRFGIERFIKDYANALTSVQ
jgi:glycosyltransferase involved in cell wall biosynthesis